MELVPWEIIGLAATGGFVAGGVTFFAVYSLVAQPSNVYAKGYHEGYERGHIEGFYRGRLHEAYGDG